MIFVTQAVQVLKQLPNIIYVTCHVITVTYL